MPKPPPDHPAFPGTMGAERGERRTHPVLPFPAPWVRHQPIIWCFGPPAPKQPAPAPPPPPRFFSGGPPIFQSGPPPSFLSWETKADHRPRPHPRPPPPSAPRLLYPRMCRAPVPPNLDRVPPPACAAPPSPRKFAEKITTCCTICPYFSCITTPAIRPPAPPLFPPPTPPPPCVSLLWWTKRPRGRETYKRHSPGPRITPRPL